jgi:hypothetical protein
VRRAVGGRGGTCQIERPYRRSHRLAPARVAARHDLAICGHRRCVPGRALCQEHILAGAALLVLFLLLAALIGRGMAFLPASSLSVLGTATPYGAMLWLLPRFGIEL